MCTSTAFASGAPAPLVNANSPRERSMCAATATVPFAARGTFEYAHIRRCPAAGRKECCFCHCLSYEQPSLHLSRMLQGGMAVVSTLLVSARRPLATHFALADRIVRRVAEWTA
eukprot:6204193-Pleurochrysis_carterae.AAC.3